MIGHCAPHYDAATAESIRLYYLARQAETLAARLRDAAAARCVRQPTTETWAQACDIFHALFAGMVEVGAAMEEGGSAGATVPTCDACRATDAAGELAE